MPSGIYQRTKFKTIQEQFWSKVKYSDDLFSCWEWQGSFDNKHYGRIFIKRKSVLAHRISYLIHNGTIDDNLMVLHKCNNPKCWNPAHLYQGTAKDNANDKVKSHRQYCPIGELHHKVKLTDKNILEILQLLKTNISGKDIAKIYMVSPTIISFIKHNKSWKHIPRD